MPKTYAAGDQLTAAEYNQVVKVSGLYQASSAGSDTYAITVSPVPTTYAAGDVYHFKADVANTGPATLNVNGLGNVAIVKNYNTALVTGDILAGQIVTVVYDSNSNFQMLSPIASIALYKCGTTTHDISATGAQTIAHGLGVTPKFIRLSAVCWFATSVGAFSFGTYNGTTTAGILIDLHSGSGADQSSANVITILDASGVFANATVTVDGTNINLTWAKTGSPTGTAYLLWEAYA